MVIGVQTHSFGWLVGAQMRGLEKMMVDLKLASLQSSAHDDSEDVSPTAKGMSLHARCLMAQQHLDRFKV